MAGSEIGWAAGCGKVGIGGGGGWCRRGDSNPEKQEIATLLHSGKDAFVSPAVSTFGVSGCGRCSKTIKVKRSTYQPVFAISFSFLLLKDKSGEVTSGVPLLL